MECGRAQMKLLERYYAILAMHTRLENLVFTIILLFFSFFSICSHNTKYSLGTIGHDDGVFIRFMHMRVC